MLHVVSMTVVYVSFTGYIVRKWLIYYSDINTRVNAALNCVVVLMVDGNVIR